MQGNFNKQVPHQASFRDPSGFVFTNDEVIYRQVNTIYKPHYDHLMASELYAELSRKKYLLEHTEIKLPFLPENAYKILRPAQLDFISYPYEWCFSQLKDAALRTLDIQDIALKYGMTLKDASAYNIQFVKGAPTFIDTLSFEIYNEGSPWNAYRQFCMHFLAPLALMSRTDIRLEQLLKVYIEGIPLDLASTLLPKRTWINFGLLTHVHLHAKMQKHYSNTDSRTGLSSGGYKPPHISKSGLISIIDSLRNTIRKLEWKPTGTEWAEYYNATNYSDFSFDEKSRIVGDYLNLIEPKTVWDLGANTGHFSQLASDRKAETIAFDIDPSAVEINYLSSKKRERASPLPLLLDLTNPSPSLGWHSKERDSLIERGSVDCAMALALIHHLAISNNVPMNRIAAFFAEISQHLIIEFVPKSDSQVQRLLSSREDIFDTYTKEYFESSFSSYFSIRQIRIVEGSERTLYLMDKLIQ